MKVLVITPIQAEIHFFLQRCQQQGIHAEKRTIGRLSVTHFPELEMVVALGGLGKAQFAVQTQHLIDHCPQAKAVICAGAAGALVNHLAIGDIVVATEVVEHDIHNKFGKPLLPRFRSDSALFDTFTTLSTSEQPFGVHFAPIASGDEDVVDNARRHIIQNLTGATAVAWEGAGGARACQFSGIPFVEVRGITDNADSTAAADFEANLNLTLSNVATYLITWAKTYATS